MSSHILYDDHVMENTNQTKSASNENPFKLTYPELTMFQMVERMAQSYPQTPAYEFYGRKTTYSRFIRLIEQAARAFTTMGIGKMTGSR